MESLLERTVQKSRGLIQKGIDAGRKKALPYLAAGLAMGASVMPAEAQEVEMPQFRATVVTEQGDTLEYENINQKILEIGVDDRIDIDPDKFMFEEDGRLMEGQYDFAIYDITRDRWVLAGPDDDNVCNRDGRLVRPQRKIIPTNAWFRLSDYGLGEGQYMLLKMDQGNNQCDPRAMVPVYFIASPSEAVEREIREVRDTVDVRNRININGDINIILGRDGDRDNKDKGSLDDKVREDDDRRDRGRDQARKDEDDSSLILSPYASFGAVKTQPPEEVDPRGTFGGGGIQFTHYSDQSLLKALIEGHGINWDHFENQGIPDTESLFLRILYANNEGLPVFVGYEHGRMTEPGLSLSGESPQVVMHRPVAGFNISPDWDDHIEYMNVLLGMYANFLNMPGASTRTEYGVRGGLEAKFRDDRVGAEISGWLDRSLNNPVVQERFGDVVRLESSTGGELRAALNFFVDDRVSIDFGGLLRGREERFSFPQGVSAGDSWWSGIIAGVSIYPP